MKKIKTNDYIRWSDKKVNKWIYKRRIVMEKFLERTLQLTTIWDHVRIHKPALKN